MAALVLGLAGSAIGGSAAVTGALGISSAMGASVGWAIGSMLGGMIGPKQKIEGPRLQDGKVQASTHGQVIPIIYGSYRTAGNIIDFSGMREHAKKERSKKAKTVMTTYSYECDVAVGICEGTIGGVRRIWANNELIYSVAEDADLATIQASNNAAGNIKIYTGSETQLPDPTLEALHGAGNVPAYRGLAYIVISRIWVEKYGNRLPNFEFEVVGGDSLWGATQFLGGTRTTRNSLVTIGGVAYDYAISGANLTVRKISPLESVLAKSYELPSIGNMPSWFIPAGSEGLVNVSYAVHNTLADLSIVIVYAVSLGGGGDYYSQSFFYFFHPSIGLSSPVLRAAFEIIFLSNSNATLTLYDDITGGGGAHMSHCHYSVNISENSIDFQLTNERPFDSSILPLIVFQQDNELLYSYEMGAIRVYDITDFGQYDEIALSSLPSRFNTYLSVVKVSGNTITCLGVTKIGSSPYRLERIVLTIDGNDVVGFTTDVLIDNYNMQAVQGVAFINYGGAYLERVFTDVSPRLRNYLSESSARTSSSLRNILTDIAARVGVSPDVSEIPVDLEVGGYCISRQISARGAIEPLQNAYFFDAVESDNGLKFIMRGGDQVATIIEDDMMAGVDQPADGDPATVVRGQEVELPQSVSVSYADWNSDYQISSEMVQRQVTPSVNKVSTELPIAMSADQAARIADVWMYQAWSERTQLAFKVGAKHMKLEPTDVIEVQTAGQTFKARITGKTDDRGVIDISAVVDSGRYTSNATGSSNLGSQTNIAIQSPSMALLLDSPIITDADNDAGIYASLIPEAVLSQSVTWGGATLMAGESSSSANNAVGAVGQPIVSVCQVLEDVLVTYANVDIVDQSRRITVKTNGTDLSSISRAHLYQGGNLFALVNSFAGEVVELLQFQFAEEIDEFTYRLTGLLRGRYGTERAARVYNIKAGSYLVQMAPRDTLLRVPLTAQQIGAPLYYKAITNAGQYDNQPAKRYSAIGRGLRPYAPVHLTRTKDTYDNWHIRWTRRSRIDGGLRDGVDVPIGEGQEKYSLLIDRDGTPRILTTNYYVLTSIEQINIFGEILDFILFSVAQISDTLGEGDRAFYLNIGDP